MVTGDILGHVISARMNASVISANDGILTAVIQPDQHPIYRDSVRPYIGSSDYGANIQGFPHESHRRRWL